KIDTCKSAMTEDIAMRLAIRICTDFYTCDVSSVADAVACSNLGTRVLDRCKCTRAQPVGKNFAIDETIRAHDLSARIDPPYVSEISAGNIEGGEISVVQNKTMDKRICHRGVHPHDLPSSSNALSMSFESPWEIK